MLASINLSGGAGSDGFQRSLPIPTIVIHSEFFSWLFSGGLGAVTGKSSVSRLDLFILLWRE